MDGVKTLLTIYVNGFDWEKPPVNRGGEIDYESIVNFAFEKDRQLDGVSKDDVVVTYVGAMPDRGKPADATLPEGGRIKVKDGTRFTVASSNQT